MLTLSSQEFTQESPSISTGLGRTWSRKSGPWFFTKVKLFLYNYLLSLLGIYLIFLGARAPLGLLYVGLSVCLSVTNLLQNSENLIELDIT